MTYKFFKSNFNSLICNKEYLHKYNKSLTKHKKCVQKYILTCIRDYFPFECLLHSTLAFPWDTTDRTCPTLLYSRIPTSFAPYRWHILSTRFPRSPLRCRWRYPCKRIWAFPVRCSPWRVAGGYHGIGRLLLTFWPRNPPSTCSLKARQRGPPTRELTSRETIETSCWNRKLKLIKMLQILMR